MLDYCCSGASLDKVCTIFEEEDVYHIVGSTEADPTTNKISDESPVGRALLGHKVNDVVNVEAPAGEIKLKIVGISK